MVMVFERPASGAVGGFSGNRTRCLIYRGTLKPSRDAEAVRVDKSRKHAIPRKAPDPAKLSHLVTCALRTHQKRP